MEEENKSFLGKLKKLTTDVCIFLKYSAIKIYDYLEAQVIRLSEIIGDERDFINARKIYRRKNGFTTIFQIIKYSSIVFGKGLKNACKELKESIIYHKDGRKKIDTEFKKEYE